MRSGLSKGERIMQHFAVQQGRCWICGFPMLPYIYSCKSPNRFRATLDHLVEKNTTNGLERPVKAAHAWCNSVRQHNKGVPDKHIKRIADLFNNKDWVQMVFGGKL